MDILDTKSRRSSEAFRSVDDGESDVSVVSTGQQNHALAGVALAWAGAAVLSACGGGQGGDTPVSGFYDLTSARAQPDLLLTPHLRVSAPGVGKVPDANAVMDWAEYTFPTLFPGPQATASSPPYLMRTYPATGMAIGIAGDAVYVMGPITGGALLQVGKLADFAAAVYADYGGAKPASDEEAARFLLQAQFSASDAGIAALRQQGYGPWLAAQATMPASTGAWDWLVAKGYTKLDDFAYFGQGYPQFFTLWYQLIASPDAYRKRMALALSEFFVATLEGVGSDWRAFVIADYWDMLVANVSGNFRTLLEKVTLHNAIGELLNTAGNQKEDPSTGRLPDENYAREVMQLFTIGLYQLNLDGTPQRDASGKPVETYAQSDVTQLARVFTGYDLDYTGLQPTRLALGGVQYSVQDVLYTRRPMRFITERHSYQEVSFLGTRIPAGTAADVALKQALDTLFNHPNVGPFFGKQMIQRLVTSAPSPSYVARVAAAFNNNGAGVRGDLRAVFTAVLLDPEARSSGSASAAGFGKLREPMLRFAQWARTFGMTSAAGTWKLWPNTEQQPLYSPTVFNFFRPGYVPPGTPMAATQSPAPEFQLVTESSVATYINFMRGLTRVGVFTPAPDHPAFYVDINASAVLHNASDGYDLVPDYSAELALVGDAEALVRRLNRLLCAGQLSAPTQALIANAYKSNFNGISTSKPRNDQLDAVGWAVFLVMVAPEYLVQK